MDIFQAIILGIVQGLAEWLPISSSGHLVLFQTAFKINEPVFFDVLLHVGTLLAVMLYFRKDLIKLTKLTLKGDFKDEGRVVPYAILALVATGVVAFFFRHTAEAMFSDAHSVGYAFLAMGCVLLATKFIGKGEKMSQNMGWKSPILIGLAQGVAVIPGISRSGSTMAAGMMSGLNKEQAARFSFLLSIPAIIAAAIAEYEPIAFTPEVVLGAVFAFVVGYATIGMLLKIVRKKKFYLFGFYCFAIGLIALTFL